MKVSYIALSIPVFFLLIGIELLVGYLKKEKLYRFNDALTNINLGTGQQIVGVMVKGFFFLGYLFLYDRRLFDIPNTWWSWTLLFLGVDFFYYWFHRASHEINALWAAHIVHHQSEDYNLSVALRQSWFQGWFSWAFYLPLAVVGFDPIMFAAVNSFNTLYQFWIHTTTIKSLDHWNGLSTRLLTIGFTTAVIQNTSIRTMQEVSLFGIGCSAHSKRRKKK